MKFLLLTGTMGGQTERLACAFGRSDADWLDTLPDAVADDPPEARTIVLSRSLIESWDPEHLSVPMLTSTVDLDLLVRISGTVPRLGDREGWGAAFGRELNATEDAKYFVARRGHRRDLYPVIDGKHLDSFRLAATRPARAISRDAAATLLDPRKTFDRTRLAYRDVASATNRLTLIAALLPPGVVSTHTVFCLKTPRSDPDLSCLLALLNSLIANYLVRLQVTTHVTTAVMSRLPVPRPAARSVEHDRLVALAQTLERDGIGNIDAYADLNALVARLYGLSRSHFEHVVSTFPLLPEALRVACIDAYITATESLRHGEDK